MLRQYSDILQMRGSEGFITIDTTVDQIPKLPTIVISGHRQIEGVTNITLDHVKAARLVMGHLCAIGAPRHCGHQGPTTQRQTAARDGTGSPMRLTHWESSCGPS